MYFILNVESGRDNPTVRRNKNNINKGKIITVAGGANCKDIKNTTKIPNSKPIISNDVIVALIGRNILGKKIATIFEGKKPAGYHSFIWDANNYSSGLYIYRFSSQGKRYSELIKSSDGTHTTTLGVYSHAEGNSPPRYLEKGSPEAQQQYWNRYINYKGKEKRWSPIIEIS